MFGPVPKLMKRKIFLEPYRVDLDWSECAGTVARSRCSSNLLASFHDAMVGMVQRRSSDLYYIAMVNLAEFLQGRGR